MSKAIVVNASKVINARPEEIYAILSDYRVGHAAILPKPYFTEMIVEQGGQGAGTILRLKMNVFGQEYTYHQIVTEPEPGRLLVDTDMETGQFSSFTLEPLNGGAQTRVTIHAEFPGKTGIAGWLEKLMQPPITRYIFKKELRNLADYARSKAVLASAT
jgi:Polyketide cyclase / dehydrase and lipid transport